MRFFGISFVTLLTVFAILGTDTHGIPAQTQLKEGSAYFVVITSMGALIGVFTVREHIGGEGVIGLLITIFSFYFATLIGVFIAGTLLFPILGTYLAVYWFWSIPWTLASGAIAWWVGVLILHFVTLHLLPKQAE